MSSQSLGQIKTIGIISAVGEQLNYHQIGITAFSNDDFHQPIRRYGVDTYVTTLLGKELAGRYAVKPVTYDPADFQPDKVAITKGEEIFGTGAPIGEVIRAKAMPNNLDAYVLVVSSNSGVKNSNQVVGGLGITRRAMAFYHLYWAHALYGIAVIDGQTGKSLAWNAAPGGQQELGHLEIPAVYGPYKDVDEAYWPGEDATQFPPEVVKKLVDLTKELIAGSLHQTVQAVGLMQ